jgi:hypothetical protein
MAEARSVLLSSYFKAHSEKTAKDAWPSEHWAVATRKAPKF